MFSPSSPVVCLCVYVCAARYVRYQIDNSVVRSPYAVWQQAGKPDYPSYSLLQQMRDAAVSGRTDTYAYLIIFPARSVCTVFESQGKIQSILSITITDMNGNVKWNSHCLFVAFSSSAEKLCPLAQ